LFWRNSRNISHKKDADGNGNYVQRDE
jgi:hypothetical protein